MLKGNNFPTVTYQKALIDFYTLTQIHGIIDKTVCSLAAWLVHLKIKRSGLGSKEPEGGINDDFLLVIFKNVMMGGVSTAN